MRKFAHVLAIGGAAAVALVAATVPGFAATTTATFTVSTTIVGSCTISANNLTFPNYDPNSGNNVDGSTTVTVNCPSGTNYVVALSYGANGGSVSDRIMAPSSGTANLAYNLYTDSAYSNVWNDTTNCSNPNGSGSSCSYGTGTGANQQISVYGQIAASQSGGFSVGTSYTDTITATVTY